MGRKSVASPLPTLDPRLCTSPFQQSGGKLAFRRFEIFFNFSSVDQVVLQSAYSVFGGAFVLEQCTVALYGKEHRSLGKI
jgi:hypothetical protein